MFGREPEIIFDEPDRNIRQEEDLQSSSSLDQLKVFQEDMK